MITDNQGRQFVFNGDNKQKEVKDANNYTVGTYFYDGDGNRVKKVSVSDTTVFVYDASRKLVAEYSTQVASSPTISYLTNDTLGSPRVISDNSGAVISRRDFMPFGEELYAGTANRTTAAKYSTVGMDNVRKRFTGYEKDTETGLDFAEARYYDNRYGRFTAVDPLLASGKSANPQTFNRYVYVSNNPINFTDPSGMDWGWTSGGGGFLSYEMWSLGFSNWSQGGLYESRQLPSGQPIRYEEYTKTKTTTTTTIKSRPNPFADPQFDRKLGTFTSVRILEEYNGEVLSDSSETTDQTSSFMQLWQAHPIRLGLANPIDDTRKDGKLVYENQCAIRLSWALIFGGFADQFVKTFHGKTVRGFAIRARELAAWLPTVFGPPIQVTGNMKLEYLSDKRGIVFLDTFPGTQDLGRNFNHIDLFNYGTFAKGDYRWIETAKKVLFWPIR